MARKAIQSPTSAAARAACARAEKASGTPKKQDIFCPVLADRNPKRWIVNLTYEERGGVDHSERVAYVCSGDTPIARAIRDHEMGHIKYTPVMNRKKFAKKNKISEISLAGLEDYRVNRLVREDTGVDSICALKDRPHDVRQVVRNCVATCKPAAMANYLMIQTSIGYSLEELENTTLQGMEREFGAGFFPVLHLIRKKLQTLTVVGLVAGCKIFDHYFLPPSSGGQGETQRAGEPMAPEVTQKQANKTAEDRGEHFEENPETGERGQAQQPQPREAQDILGTCRREESRLVILVQEAEQKPGDLSEAIIQPMYSTNCVRVVHNEGQAYEGEALWCPMTITTNGLADPNNPARLLKKRRLMMGGRKLKNIARLGLDGMAFQEARRVRTGSFLCDVSGSMGGAAIMTERIVSKIPGATVLMYAGNGIKGELVFVAHNGKKLSSYAISRKAQDMGGRNSVDGPALEFLGRCQGPRLWISDGEVNGLRGNRHTIAMGREVAETLKKSRIKHINNVHDLKTFLRIDFLSDGESEFFG